MKIGLISRGRTQSSAVIASLAHNYQLINLSEIYFQVLPTVRSIVDVKNKLLKINTDPKAIFAEKIKNLTNKISIEDNYICKLWPSMITFYNYDMNCEPNKELFDSIKKNILFDITNYWKIKEYNILFFLDRDLYESTYSWVYCKKTSLFHNYKIGNITYRKDSPSLILENKDFATAKKYILEYCLQHKLKEFIIQNNLHYIDITDCTNLYIDNDIVKTQPTNKNYKQLITNSDELHDLIEKWYPICMEYTKDWHFY